MTVLRETARRYHWGHAFDLHRPIISRIFWSRP
jgi:hypothetical protein